MTSSFNEGLSSVERVPRGGGALGGAGALHGSLGSFMAGMNPFGYKITELGEQYLSYEGSLDGDIGRFLASLKNGQRKRFKALKSQWMEVVRVAKTRQAMRIYRTLEELIDFCLKAGFIE